MQDQNNKVDARNCIDVAEALTELNTQKYDVECIRAFAQFWSEHPNCVGMTRGEETAAVLALIAVSNFINSIAEEQPLPNMPRALMKQCQNLRTANHLQERIQQFWSSRNDAGACKEA